MWTVAAFLSLSIVSSGADDTYWDALRSGKPATPGVYALVIAVADYGSPGINTKAQEERDLPGAIDAAERFTAHLQAAFGDAGSFTGEIKRLYLPISPETIAGTEPPTETVVREYVERCLPRVPPGSLVVIYFAGHGTRRDAEDEDAPPGDLHLRLAESTLDDFETTCVRATDVLSALHRAVGTTCIVILDCCQSAPLDRDRASPWIKDDLGGRGFMMGACFTTSETARLGRMTRGLVEKWASGEGESCRNPEGLCNEVTSLLINDPDKSVQDAHVPSLWFGDQNNRCLGTFARDSCMIVLQLVADPAQRVTVQTNNDKDLLHHFESGRPLQALYLLPRAPMAIDVLSNGARLCLERTSTTDGHKRVRLRYPGANDESTCSFQVTVEDLKDRLLLVEIDLPPDAWRAAKSEEVLRQYTRTCGDIAVILERQGYSSFVPSMIAASLEGAEDASIDPAQVWRVHATASAAQLRPVSFLHTLSSSATGSSGYACVSPLAPSLPDWLAIKGANEHGFKRNLYWGPLQWLMSSDELQQGAATLEILGEHASAGRLFASAASKESPGEHSPLYLRAFVNARLAGDTKLQDRALVGFGDASSTTVHGFNKYFLMSDAELQSEGLAGVREIAVTKTDERLDIPESIRLMRARE